MNDDSIATHMYWHVLSVLLTGQKEKKKKKKKKKKRESHLKRETSIEKAAGEANYLFRAVIANQHFFKTVIVPFILLAVQTPPLPINTALQLHLIGSWTVSQTQRYREWFAWIGSDKKCT